MSKASLYVNTKGYDVTYHSYSGSTDFNHCARYYQLKRQAGWSEIKQSAAMKFGIAMEAAITEFHRAQGLDAAWAAFAANWDMYKDDKELSYSKKHVDWANLQQVAWEMIRLYAIKFPHFPYTIEDPATAFQVQHNLEIFPGTELAGLELTSYIDIMVKLKAGSCDPTINDDRGILDMKVRGQRS